MSSKPVSACWLQQCVAHMSVQVIHYLQHGLPAAHSSLFNLSEVVPVLRGWSELDGAPVSGSMVPLRCSTATVLSFSLHFVAILAVGWLG